MGNHWWWWCGKHLSHPRFNFFVFCSKKTFYCLCILRMFFSHCALFDAFTQAVFWGPDLCFTFIVRWEFLAFHRCVCATLWRWLITRILVYFVVEQAGHKQTRNQNERMHFLSLNFSLYLSTREGELLSTANEEEEEAMWELIVESNAKWTLNKQKCRDGGDGGRRGCTAANF